MAAESLITLELVRKDDGCLYAQVRCDAIGSPSERGQWWGTALYSIRETAGNVVDQINKTLGKPSAVAFLREFAIAQRENDGDQSGYAD